LLSINIELMTRTVLLDSVAKLANHFKRILSSESVSPSIVIMPPASPGSLGDEAVVLAVRDQIRANGTRDIAVINYQGDNSWEHIVGCDHSYLLKNSTASMILFILWLIKYNTLYLLATDVLDGFYSSKYSVFLIDSIRLASLSGVDVHVLGFSFNHDPAQDVVRALKQIPGNVRLCVRDKISKKRIESTIGREVELVADIAFLLDLRVELESTKEWIIRIQERRADGRMAVGINANPRHFQNFPEVSQEQFINSYVDALTNLSSELRNIDFYLLPHDNRGKVSDLTVCNDIYGLLPTEIKNVSAVVDFSKAREVKAMCGEMDFVITGRMHIAIACLGMGVPVISIDYQEKFDGLYEHFLLVGMVLTPVAAFRENNLSSFMLSNIRKSALHSEVIASNLDRVVELARNNLRNLRHIQKIESTNHHFH